MAETNSNGSETNTNPTAPTEASLANTSPETKPEGTNETTKTNETSLANEKTEAQKTGAPEKYEPFKAPEGLTFAEESLTKANTLFKELGLSQEHGQKLMDLYAAEVQAVQKSLTDTVAENNKTWRTEITNDPKYGDGNGKLKGTTLKAIADVKNQLPADIRTAFEEAMDFTGAGNHPGFIKGLVALAEKLGEGAHVAGNGPTKGGQERPGSVSGIGPRALYPDNKSGAAGG